MRYLSFYVTIKNDQEEKDIVIQIAICVTTATIQI